ncbi:MAG: hypothetical protein ACLTSO_08740 [Coprococcus sp.]
MYGETGEPKDGNTKIAGQGHCRTENMECGKELDMQNETDKQILSTLNQDNFQNSSGGKKAAEDDEMGLFSQGFMDRMREMVSEQFGEEAAERFMVQNKDMIKEEKTTSAVPESEKRLPQTKNADAHTEQSIPFTAEHPDILRRQPLKGHRSAHTVDGSGAQLQYLWLYWRVLVCTGQAVSVPRRYLL